ncbi:MAG: SGNH/GDSL hydrolase family protein [Eubacteriales bacterium]|nr:SGNH/GDSL hydrolase family protein [Eubacteriales bacterium]
MMSSIHIWGDSIGKGVVYDESRGRYVISGLRWTTQIEDRLGIPVQNHARMGAVIRDGLRELERSQDLSGAIAVIEFGGNDCDLPWAEVAAKPDQDHPAKVPVDLFRSLLEQFIRQVRSRGARPLLVTPPPLDAARYFAWVTRQLDAEAVRHYLGDIQHIYRWQERYAIAVRDVAQKLNCELFDLRDAFLAERDVASFLCVDGIHPNERGQSLIAQAALLLDRRYFKAGQETGSDFALAAR